MFCLALAPVTLAAADKRVHKTVPLEGNGVLTINTHNGSIDITPWNQPSADIDAVVEEGDMASAEDVQRTEIRITGSGSSVRVESDYSAVESHFTWLGVSRVYPQVRYTIRMPATARLDIDEHNGKVRIAGLRSDMEINTHNGPVDIDDYAGRANVETHNGDVRVAFSRFDKGSSFQTHNGTIDVRMPAASRFHLDADGHHLGFTSDFPIVAQHTHEGRYTGDVNGGGPELRFSTHNGSLHLRRG